MTIQTRSTVPFRVTVLVTLTAASLWINHPSGAQAVVVDRGSRDYTLPDQIQWRDTENGKTANLHGDPSKPGLYAYIVKRGPNVWSKPHFHDNDRFVTVLEVTFWVGTGTFDQQRTVPLKTGSFVRDVARGIHFDGTKDDGATLYFVGIGRSLSHPAAPSTTATSGSGADVIDPAIRQIQPIENMPKESFVLYGDSSQPGLYLQYQRTGHPITGAARTITRSTVSSWVLGGTMRIGTEPAATRQDSRSAEGRIHPRYRARLPTTTGPGTIRCGFRLPASGPRRLSTSTHRNSSARPRNSGADVQECRQQHVRLRTATTVTQVVVPMSVFRQTR